MGRWGSGRWGYSGKPDKKGLADHARSLDVVLLTRARVVGPNLDRKGEWWWTASPGAEKPYSRIGFEVRTGADGGEIRLRYTVGVGRGEGQQVREEVDLRVPLLTSLLVSGGRRWWFECPVAKHKRPCRRRVGKLYLPRGGKLWACRTCYDLTYAACQGHRKPGAFLLMIAAECGIPASQAGRILQAPRMGWERRAKEAACQRAVFTDA